ncbi:MAG: nicotinamide-nucleotide amidohydrolase family protein [Coriobacteriia bacterium]|nr:nicotinamide-nucleotide amidohydrolase family protein [Coriobacteriia bacterium]
MAPLPAAAVVTVGTELTTGLRQDTNSTEIARALNAAGYVVHEIRSVPDDMAAIEAAVKALLDSCDLVVVTGGLGPTHDDITREAAARALGRSLHRDETIAVSLRAMAARHTNAEARKDMLRQADVIEGATVLPARTGSAPGQAVTVGGATLVLLPGPPGEMRPLLEGYLAARTPVTPPERLRCTGITESDAQRLVQPAIAPFVVDLTLLAAPADVEVVLFPKDGDASDLPAATRAALRALGDRCYSADGSSLAETIVRLAIGAGEHIVTAESCTGGMVASALTDVAGSSSAFAGGVVAYANEVKMEALGVPAGLLAQFGAVSEETARAMAEGALSLPGSTISVAVTGIAGPEGGTPDKPVGLVWFAVAHADGRVRAISHHLPGDRAAVRRRAVIVALDALRRDLAEG